MDGGAWGRLLSMGSQRVGHDWVTSLHFLHTFCHPFTLSRWSCLHLSCDNGDVMGWTKSWLLHLSQEVSRGTYLNSTDKSLGLHCREGSHVEGGSKRRSSGVSPLSLGGAPVCALGKRSEKTVHWACTAFDRRHFKQAAGGAAASGPIPPVPTALWTNRHSAGHAVCRKLQGHEDCMWGATHCGNGRLSPGISDVIHALSQEHFYRVGQWSPTALFLWGSEVHLYPAMGWVGDHKVAYVQMQRRPQSGPVNPSAGQSSPGLHVFPGATLTVIPQHLPSTCRAV